jgi:hypothetical protein
VSPTDLPAVGSGGCCATAADDKSANEIITEKEINRIGHSTRKARNVTPASPSSQRQRSLLAQRFCGARHCAGLNRADPAAALRNPSMQAPMCDHPSHSDFR